MIGTKRWKPGGQHGDVSILQSRKFYNTIGETGGLSKPKAEKRMTVVRLPARTKTPAGRRRRADEIINAAARVFAERGYYGASTQDIADVLGIRQASLYYYFASKEAALELVCARGVEGFLETAQRIVAEPGNASLKLARLINAHLKPLGDRRNFVTVFLNERRYLPTASRQRIGRTARAYERILENVLNAGIRSGEFSREISPRLVTLALIGMMNAAQRWYGKEPDATIEQIANEFHRLTLSGIMARSGRAK
jgi:AcrR family transcriptional regulator